MAARKARKPHKPLTGRDRDWLEIVAKAAARGDVVALEDYCAQQEWFLNYIGPHGRTLFWEAARGGKLDALKWLYEKGAHPNIVAGYHHETTIELTPWGIAKVKKRASVCDWLAELGFGDDVYTACYLGDLDRVRRDLDADPDQLDRPLTRGHSETENDYAVPLLGYAVAGGHCQIAKLLLERGARTDYEHERLVTWAYWSDQPDLVALVLEYGARPEEGQLVEWADEPALLAIAADYGWSVEIDAWNKMGFPPLVEACRGNHNAPDDPSRVQEVLDLGARIDVVDYKGKTCMHRAMQAGFVAIPELLVENGAGLEARDAKGETPLFDAVRYGRLDSVLWLLEQGVVSDVVNDRGQSPLDIAERSKKTAAREIRRALERVSRRS